MYMTFYWENMGRNATLQQQFQQHQFIMNCNEGWNSLQQCEKERGRESELRKEKRESSSKDDGMRHTMKPMWH